MISIAPPDHSPSPSLHLCSRPLGDEVQRAIHRLGYAALRRLAVDATDNQLILRGELPSFYLRQLAIHCAKSVAGVAEVVDAISVSYIVTDRD